MTIYVSNLGFHVESDAIKTLFEAYGEVDSVKVITDRMTNKSRGFAFIEMKDDTAGNEAISKLNGQLVEGRQLVVNVARPKEKNNFRASMY